jgi:hypothetical protein
LSGSPAASGNWASEAAGDWGVIMLSNIRHLRTQDQVYEELYE